MYCRTQRCSLFKAAHLFAMCLQPGAKITSAATAERSNWSRAGVFVPVFVGVQADFHEGAQPHSLSYHLHMKGKNQIDRYHTIPSDHTEKQIAWYYKNYRLKTKFYLI